MRHKIRLLVIILILTALALPLTAHAAVVGRFSLIVGQVDLLKGGKLPAESAKLQGGVEPGDIIRTKTKAKAQLTMVDNSVITLAPESRLAIADYQYNPAQESRRAVVRLFRGLVHTVVNRVIKTEEPDFLMETHTAVIGVRGTNFYTLVGPSFTATYLANGTLGVSSNLSTLPALLLLHSMQFTQIPLGKQPFLAQTLTPGDARHAGAPDGHRVERIRVWIWLACPRYRRPDSISSYDAGEPGPEALAANDPPGAPATAAASGSCAHRAIAAGARRLKPPEMKI